MSQPATSQAVIGRLLRNLCWAALCVSVSSCALSERMERITLSAERARSDIQERHDAFAQAITSRDARKAAQDVDRPWIAGRAIRYARNVTLPRALGANVNHTLHFSVGMIGRTSGWDRVCKYVVNAVVAGLLK